MTSSSRRLVGRLLSAFRSLRVEQPDETTHLMTLRGEVRTLRARLGRHEAAERHSRQRVRRFRALAVDTQHLKSVLPLRAAAVRDAPDERTAAREADFVTRVKDYDEARRAWTQGERPPAVRAVESDGLRWSIPADLGGDGSLSRRIERGWLPFHDIAVVRSCAVGGVMLDIGANVGTTCIPRVVLGDFDVVYAAEPEAENYACLVGNVLDNGLAGRVLPERIAIGNQDGVASLARTGNIGGHHLVKEPRSEHGQLVPVPCVTIDRWLQRLGVAPAAVTFVKVDTQGWDLEVLKGASTLLALKHVVWQLEITRMVKRSGETLERFAELLREHFTFAKPLGGHSEAVRPIADVLERLERIVEEDSFVNLLLLNRAEA
jgi:FkbM family methyltransferase